MKNKGDNVLKKNLILAILVVVIAAAPLLLLKDAEFGGSDDQAEKAITEINENYKPWFLPVWEPPSAEIESLLFSLQAAIGSGIICYYLGYLKGKSKGLKDKTDDFNR